jgi:streptomycin 3"-adenylyltransferase
MLAENLVGIYVHGSAAMGGFNPARSDLDALIMVQDSLSLEIKQSLIPVTFRLVEVAPAKGLEFSVVLLRATQDFVYPTPYEFHYSQDWYEAYATDKVDLIAPQTDADLAAHFMVTRSRGVCIDGIPIDQVFGPVPSTDYWQSLLWDAQGILADMSSEPVYAVLNLCRIVAYQREQVVLSKYEGGKWGLRHLPAAFHVLIEQALRQYEAQMSVTLD